MSARRPADTIPVRGTFLCDGCERASHRGYTYGSMGSAWFCSPQCQANYVTLHGESKHSRPNLPIGEAHRQRVERLRDRAAQPAKPG